MTGVKHPEATVGFFWTKSEEAVAKVEAWVGSPKKNWKRLKGGSNNYGVYKVGDRVFKVTVDTDEFENAAKLKAMESLPHLARILDATRFQYQARSPTPENMDDGIDDFYVVLMPLYERLSTAEKRQFGRLTSLIEFCDITKKYRLHAPTLKPVEPFDIRDYLWNGHNRPARVVKKYQEIAEKYQIPEMAQEMARTELFFDDLHNENIAKNGKDYVLLDYFSSW
jgi:hypothetical protein